MAEPNLNDILKCLKDLDYQITQIEKNADKTTQETLRKALKPGADIFINPLKENFKAVEAELEEQTRKIIEERKNEIMSMINHIDAYFNPLNKDTKSE